jgi:phosphoribosylformylglycinamidine synthase subunit PurS
MVKIQVHIRLKKGILDPQGTTVKHALDHLGFKGVGDVRLGKLVDITLNTDDEAQAKQQAEEMAKKLLANPIIEDFEVKIQ